MPVAKSEDIDLDDISKWDEKSKAKVLAALEAEKKTKKAWYCKRGRMCDGLPHEGYDYKHARGDQWPPPGTDWFVWLIISGRGSGKTRTGAEFLRKMSEHVGRMAMVGRRGPDVRGTMVEGESGLIYVCERAGIDYDWQPSKKEFRFGNGALVTGYSAEEPDTLRGPQQGVAWLDEPAHMPLIEYVWDNLLMGLRVDGVPGGAKALCTSTPLPTKWLKDLRDKESTVTVSVPTHVNLHNLDPQFRQNIIDKYEGTRIGRQELYGEILEDVEGALWNMDLIEPYRDFEALPEHMDRIVIGIDPAGTSSKKRDETGIVVVGRRGNALYVLDDVSGHFTPNGWAEAAWKAYDQYHADKIVAEKNYGGEMVLSTLRNYRDKQKGFVDAEPILVHSRRGKVLRAEPIVGLYEQKRVHHVKVLEDLESQMVGWVPDASDSPDRVDALVHGLTELGGIAHRVEIAAPTATNIHGNSTIPAFLRAS
jgi:phage terminase large subunit-like protein